MNIGIVGAEAAKFTREMQDRAIHEILCIFSTLATEDITLISGGCHLGGIDIWAEEIADELGIEKIIHKPKRLEWNGGYRERNLKIARDSDIVHNIVVAGYRSGYQGMRFSRCYHCGTDEHIKSGGCWTARRAKEGIWHVIPVIEDRISAR